MKELIRQRLIDSFGLSRDDAENVAAEVKRWIEDPDAKPSKAIHAEGKVIVTGAKDGTLLLRIAESTNVAGTAITTDSPVNLIHFPEIVVHDES